MLFLWLLLFKERLQLHLLFFAFCSSFIAKGGKEMK